LIIMTAILSGGRRPRSRQFSPDRKPAVRATLLALVASVCSQGAFAQMERANAQFHAAQTSAVVAAAAAPAVPNPNCTIIVPPNPLTAEGLATPYQLRATDPAQGPCNEANTAQSAFVQAAIINTATGAVSVYSPLVIDKGTKAAAPPIVPTLPANAIVAIWFGFQGNNLTLVAKDMDTLTNAKCVNGSGGSLFTQVAYCNAPAFMTAANAAITNGQLIVPPLGTASDGKACPTIRDFMVVDQDQSDNEPNSYLVTANGKLAQNNTANLAAFQNSTVLVNGSDNKLLDSFILPALGCSPWTVPDLSNPGQMSPAQPLNELSARYRQATPVALMPALDPMVEVGGITNLTKDNLYRLGVDQPVAGSSFYTDTGRYCRQMLRTAPARLLANQAALSKFPSLVPAAANNLFTFLAQRFMASYQILLCGTLTNQPDPISTAMDGNGVVVSATINSTQVAANIAALASTAALDNQSDAASLSLHTTETANAATAVCNTGGSSLTGPAVSYNVMIVGNGSFNSADTAATGDIAAGGAVTVANYAVAQNIAGNPNLTPNPASLVVGGALTAANGGVGQNQEGAIYVASGTPNLSGFTANGGVITGLPFDFGIAATYYQNLSAALAKITVNGTTHICDGCINFTGTNATLNVFTIAGSALGNANEITITAPATSAVVINVTGPSAMFQNGRVQLTGVSAASVVWNFPAATAINLAGSFDPMGTILAPLSPVIAGFGQASGQLIAASYTGNIAFNEIPLMCTLSVPGL
jgi:choice-of-anchor A domain-containing protein